VLHKPDLIGIFAHHPVAANLLMILIIIGGIFALEKLNIQFFPNFELDLIRVNVVWSGASAEDVETAITIPLEQTLKTVDNLRHITSTSAQGLASITLELQEGTDPVTALNQAKQRVDEFRNLPEDAEEPKVVNIIRYEPVARLLLSSTDDAREMRHLARSFEQQLLDRGIDKVDINGLPEEELSIEIASDTLLQLQMSLDEIARRIDNLSEDVPAGSFGERENTRELRVLNQRRGEQGFARLPLVSDDRSRIDLGSVAQIERHPKKSSITLSVRNHPVVELVIRRSEEGNSLEAAQRFEAWLSDTRAALPPGITLHVYNESWQLIKERIMLLVKNGAGGLILVVAILYLFLTTRVAWWVAVGIPVSFMATLLVLYLTGGSINMISLFGLIMALGIIVDDAIVVGEDALAHYQAGEEALLAAEGGARRMLAPVIASSLTTVAAFLPLMLISGPTGKILFAIPLVIISAIFASLIESFLILPGHLRHAFVHLHHAPAKGLRARLDRLFDEFKNHTFRPLVEWCLHHRGLMLSVVVALLIMVIGLLAGGRIAFNFFPSPEPRLIYVTARFVPGTPKGKVNRFLHHLEQTLIDTEGALSQQPFVTTMLTRHGSGVSSRGAGRQSGDHIGSLTVELLPPDQRTVRNKAFIKAWRQRITPPPGLETLTIIERQTGPPGRDITVRLTNHDPDRLKNAAIELGEALKIIPGVSDVADDMPFGRDQLIVRLTPTGEALGLSAAELGRQLRTAFEGRLVELFQDGPDEVEVRVKLPAQERDQLSALEKLNIHLPGGATVPLSTVAAWDSQRGFEILRHADGRLAVDVSAEVNPSINNAASILEALAESALPQLADRYGVSYSFEGRSAEQSETMAGMKQGLVIGLALIYIILAWVFASYGWPVVVMAAIPFGLIGALLGHWFMGINLTILSMFGLFALSGIVINDSIILVSFYNQLRTQGMDVHDALTEAACRRLRAVLLTSLTTIAGLAPLLFETSLQAQFLIPMAAAIAFGLAFATGLVLLVIPVLLSYHELLHRRWNSSEPTTNIDP
jgi:multidrug efflux pump subunit AcrB